MTVSAPFSSTTAPVAPPPRVPRPSLSSPIGPKTRANSPACGVSTARPASAAGIAGAGRERPGIGHHLPPGREQPAQRRPGRGIAGARPGPISQAAAAVIGQQRLGRASLTMVPGSPAR